ncbi:hypothetical protein AALA24_05710 [Anaerovoracaceae bacterium 42-11]
MRKQKIIIIFLCTMTCFFYSCSEPDNLSIKISETPTDIVVQGATDFGTFSTGESGILHIKDNHFLFFDYKSKKNYVVCSRANCGHNDSSCSGWYNGYHGALGLAEYGGKLYCFVKRQEKNIYQFIRMDLDGNNRKVIAEIDCGDSLPGSWEANLDLSYTYYTNNKVITILNWIYNPKENSEEMIQTQQCITVNLQSGKITEIMERTKEPVQCSIEAVSKDYSIIKVTGYDEHRFTEEEFYNRYEQGEFTDYTQISKAENPYEAYCDWYFDEVTCWYKYLIFDMDKKETSVLQKGVLEKVKNKNEKTIAIKPPFYIIGIYKSDLLIEKLEEGTIEDEEYPGIIKEQVYRWDLQQNKKERVLSIDNGYIFDAGGLDCSSIVDYDKLLFLRRKPEGKAVYYYYCLETEQEEQMYESVRNVPYRIVGEMKNSFIYYTADETKKSMYMLDKDDYYKGNFEKSIRIESMDEYF